MWARACILAMFSIMAMGGPAWGAGVTIYTEGGRSAMDEALLALKVSIVGGAGSGTSSTFGAAFPATGTAMGWKDGLGNMVEVSADNPLPATVTGTVSAVQSGGWTTSIGNWTSHPCAYAEDATHNSGETGCLVLGVRNDTPTPLASNGERIPLTTDLDGGTWVALNRVVTTQKRTVVSREFTILDSDEAQTNLALVSTSAGVLTVTDVKVQCSPATTATVSWRIGFAAATLPAAALGGATGIIDSGWYSPTGSPGANSPFQGDVKGAAGEDVRITIDDPVGGSCRVLIKSIED